MTDVARSHDGDCRGGPPNDSCLPVYGCQASGVPKRGRTRNMALKETIRKTENVLPIEIEMEDSTYVAVGTNGDCFNTLVGTITYYDLRPHLEGPMKKEIRSGIFTYCQRRYRDQKNKFKKEWFEDRGGLPFVDLLRSMPSPNLDDEDWNKFLNGMASPEFQRRSTKAKESRAKHKITVHQGRRSLAQNRYVNELPSPIDEYRRLRSRSGKFTSQGGADNHAQMIAMKEAQADESNPMSDQAIMEEVLRPRRGRKRGIGQQPPSLARLPQMLPRVANAYLHMMKFHR